MGYKNTRRLTLIFFWQKVCAGEISEGEIKLC